MPLRHWLHVLAIGGCLAVLLTGTALGQTTASPKKEAQQSQASQPKQAQPAAPPTPILAPKETVPSKGDGYHEHSTEYYTKADLAAQERMAGANEEMARLADRQNLITGIEAALLLLTVGFTAVATRAATRAAKAADAAVADTADTAQRQLRAYVGVSSKGIAHSGKGAKIHFQNFGQTPAQDVNIWCRVLDSPPKVFSYEDGKFLFEHTSLYPGQTLNQFWVDTLAEREGKFLYAYIDYTDIFGRRWRSRYACRHAGGDVYPRHHEHNDEIEITPPSRA